jgi:hypothetical protein
MAGGRPTKYHDDIPRLFLEAMNNGDSIVEFAADHDVCVDTIHEWKKVHPEFSEVFIRAKAKGEAFWTKWLRNNLDNNKVNAPLAKLYFANRFGWSDKKEIANNTTIAVSTQTKETVNSVLNSLEEK